MTEENPWRSVKTDPPAEEDGWPNDDGVICVSIKPEGGCVFSVPFDDVAIHFKQNQWRHTSRWLSNHKPTDPKAQYGDLTPAHYAKAVTPWDLEKVMQSSGNCFVDSRRTDAIEYCFRMKGDLLADLKKARHCLDEAIRVMEGAA